ncbi:hypothetical protein EYC80_004306 [Monilinia laxa]|uniref:Uncharacterized protein n=1 Tax=Monilinia laxa TaxID=61186 RepID=A0A5N6KPG0_MONLA|nr:hypothetical protein EYC80_004306 [Monilinia laxa]
MQRTHAFILNFHRTLAPYNRTDLLIALPELFSRSCLSCPQSVFQGFVIQFFYVSLVLMSLKCKKSSSQLTDLSR